MLNLILKGIKIFISVKNLEGNMNGSDVFIGKKIEFRWVLNVVKSFFWFFVIGIIFYWFFGFVS